MARKAFAFALGERVNVPGKKGVQGVVSLPRATDAIEAPDVAGNPDLFFVRWLQENGWPVCGWFGEPDLTAAQPAVALTIASPDLDGPTPIGSYTAIIKAGTKSQRRTRKPRRKPARKSKGKR